MRSKSTLLLVAIGCFVWFAANREALEAQSKGEVGAFDLWFPFLIPFGLGVLVRAMYRKMSNGDKESKSALTENSDSRPPKPLPEASRAVTVEKPAEDESSTTSEASSGSVNVDTSSSSSTSADPEVQRIQAELNNAQEKLELNKTKEQIDSISRRLKEAEEHLDKLKAEDISASESNSLSADEKRVERLQMQLVVAEQIADLRAQLETLPKKDNAQIGRQSRPEDRPREKETRKTDVQIEREKRYRGQSKEGPKIRKLSKDEESKQNLEDRRKRDGFYP